MGNTVSAHIYEIRVFRPYPVILYRLRLDHSIHWWKKIVDFKWGFRRTCVDALPSSTPILVVPRDTNFFPPMDRVVQSESIQYNRVGSKDLNFVDMSRNSISH